MSTILEYALQIAKQWALLGWDVSLMTEDFLLFLLRKCFFNFFFFLT